ncbi:alpha/beta hydrolase [Streptomyces sp. JJ36]|nr:alpha/beta hydrolase [Streptomyces sp. JJ36]
MVNRTVRRRAQLTLDIAGPYGSLRGTPATVHAEDGTELYYEVEEFVVDAPDGDAGGSREAREAAAAVAEGAEEPGPLGADGLGGPGVRPVRLDPPGEDPPEGARSRLLRGRGAEGAGAPPTVVFSHGYCLGQDSWHFQRAALRGGVRCVFWDQRSHGRSGRGPAGEPVSIDVTGRDLKAVLDAAVPEGPIVLVGHSMGGMTMMALAERFPEFVAERVAGAAFIGTSAGRLDEVTYGLPAAGVRAVRRLLPGALRALAAQSGLVERGRQATSDLFATLVRRYSFGSPGEVDPGVARFAQRLIEAVPVDVVAEFYPAFAEHEKTAALDAFAELPVLVLAGDRDQITPHAHSEAIAAALPGAELVTVTDGGHLVMLEQPGLVDAHLAALLARTIRSHGSTAPEPPSAGRRGRRGQGPDRARRHG